MLEVMYKAQMSRTWSLLLRHAHKNSFIVGGRSAPVSLSESPFLIHPVDQGTVGLHHKPVVVLDFASLYPSIYCAYNMCYSTLVHPDDMKHIPVERMTIAPTGAAFVKSDVRKGLLPSLLGALLSGRADMQQRMQHTHDCVQKSILNARQKALKTVANAMYGFTGGLMEDERLMPFVCW